MKKELTYWLFPMTNARVSQIFSDVSAAHVQTWRETVQFGVSHDQLHYGTRILKIQIK